MGKKLVIGTQRSSEITDMERQAAQSVIEAFSKFVKQLWAARQHDQRLVNVLEKNSIKVFFELTNLPTMVQKK